MTAPEMSLEKLTRVYVKIRDRRATIAEQFRKEDEELVAQQDEIKAALLQYCKDHDVESVRTAAGLVYRTVKVRYWTSDWEAMHRFVVEHNTPQLLEKRLNQSAVKQLLEENPEMVPPGINADSQYTITVRKA